MGDDDRLRWNERYGDRPPPSLDDIGPPAAFADHVDLFPTDGAALEVACGDGRASVWMARRGLDVVGIDVAETAIVRARELAELAGLDQRCRFDVVDLDGGLPAGRPVDVVLCHRFRQPDLHRPMVERLAPGGLLAVAVLSEVGASPGRFRAEPGELLRAFRDLEVLVHWEAEGEAGLIGRRDR